jgi:ABC-type Fe3+ transport system substrate-binding protein
VDLFFGGGDYPFIKLKSKKLLKSHQFSGKLLAEVPEQLNGVPLYQKDGSWYGAALSGFGIIYNKEILKRAGLPVPLKWEDLGREECHGWVASGDPRYSGSIHVMYEVLLQAYGWEKGWETILRMGSNVQAFTKGGSSAAKDVSIGQAAYGLAIDFYAFIEIFRYGADRLGFVLPSGETVVTPDGIGLISGGPNPEGAAAFLEYVMTEGQKLWLLKTGVPGGPVEEALCRFPVRKDLYKLDPSTLAVNQNPFEDVGTIVYNGRQGGMRWAILEDMIAAFVIIPHEDLKKCRKEMIRTKNDRKEIFTIGVSEEEAFELAQKWGKPEYALNRIRKMNEWTDSARKRYRSIFR